MGVQFDLHCANPADSDCRILIEGGEFVSLKVFSEAFENGRIQEKYGKMSDDVIEGVPQLSFPIRWEDAPEGTKSFAVVFIDYDNAIGEGIVWIHWLAANIPASATGLEEDAARTDASLLQGKTTFMLSVSNGLDNPVSNRYGGPAPEDRPHEYELQVFALSDMLDLKPGYYYNEFLKEIRGKVLDTAVIRGMYSN